jgi:UDP-N-acetylglucosamine transferase subunit ALG13
MIFVTVGTNSWDFTRLIKEMDRIAGKIDEEVIMQISHIEYKPKNAKYFSFASNEEIEELYKNARVVVSHAGVGCIISTLKHNKPIIVVPRRKEYGEHFDDHQVDIARELEREGKISVVWDVRELGEALNGVNEDFAIVKKDRKLVLALRDYINNVEKSKEDRV